MKDISAKAKASVAYLLQGFDQTAAYIKAGYSPAGASGAASRHFRRPEIAAEMERQRRAQGIAVVYNGGRGGGGRPPLNGVVQHPPYDDDNKAKAEPPPMSATERLNRELMVAALIKVINQCLGDEDVTTTDAEGIEVVKRIFVPSVVVAAVRAADEQFKAMKGEAAGPVDGGAEREQWLRGEAADKLREARTLIPGVGPQPMPQQP